MEGYTEALTWDGISGKRIESSEYHLYRTGELLGILLAIVAFGIATPPMWGLLLAGTVGVGLYLYERTFTKVRYDNWYYERTWPYEIGSLKIPYPPFILQHILAVASIAAIIVALL